MYEFHKYNKEIFLTSLLYDSIEDNDINAIKVLLRDKNANPNIVLPDKGISPFHLIVGNPKEKYAEEITNLFLRYGGDPNVRSEDNMTPLHVSSVWGKFSIVKILVKNGANIHLKDDEGFTPLDYAKIENYTQIINFLQHKKNFETQENNFNLSLRKIIINTGNVIAEYDSKNDKNYVNTLNRILKNLPEVETTSYVQNWCIKHSNFSNSNNFLNETFILDNESKLVKSQNNVNFVEKVPESRNFFGNEIPESKNKFLYFIDKHVPQKKNRQYFFEKNLEKSELNQKENFEELKFYKKNCDVNFLKENSKSSSFDCSNFLEKNIENSRDFEKKLNQTCGKNFPAFLETTKNLSISDQRETLNENGDLLRGKNLGSISPIESSFENMLEKNISSIDSSGSEKIKSVREEVLLAETQTQNLSSENFYLVGANVLPKPFSRKIEKKLVNFDFKNKKIDHGNKNGAKIKNGHLENKNEPSEIENEPLASKKLDFKSPKLINKTPKTKYNKDDHENLLRENTFLISDESWDNFELQTQKLDFQNEEKIEMAQKNVNTALKTKNWVPKTPKPNLQFPNQCLKSPNLTKNNFELSNLSSDVPRTFLEITNESVHNFSRESGIKTLSNICESFVNPLEPVAELKYMGSLSNAVQSIETSIYESCSSNNAESTKSHEINITDDSSMSFAWNKKSEVTNMLEHATGVPCQVSELDETSSDESFLSIAEEYKYEDKEDGVVLIERRLLVSPQIDIIDEIKSIKSSSTVASSLPRTIDYDTDTLRNELTYRGEKPGPITTTTKRLYLKKLLKLKKKSEEPDFMKPINTNRVYSIELEKTLKNPKWKDDLTEYKELENTMSQQFNKPDPSKKWREGLSKASFTYLLLDPRITQNLPIRSEKLTIEETWKIFLSSIFYVGKGKRSRPYAHLYDAFTKWQKNIKQVCNKKIKHILDIWSDGHGVVCLHIFQNVIPVEAYTREAAIISALKLQNLKNAQNGNFYGICNTWTQKEKRLLGVYLLYRAMLIFLNEGERQLRPNDI